MELDFCELEFYVKLKFYHFTDSSFKYFTNSGMLLNILSNCTIGPFLPYPTNWLKFQPSYQHM